MLRANLHRKRRYHFNPKCRKPLAKSCRLMRFLSNKAWLVNAAVRLARVPGLKPWVQRAIGWGMRVRVQKTPCAAGCYHEPGA
ncbi:hypothetical protein GCM10022409_13220 [Hymenobacter glaciei]|uniref:Uncharacterized protein n=1 Tax=Hymenobacter glaciei TaxID=877209 RepID=A0ABP7TRX0_9BACT